MTKIVVLSRGHGYGHAARDLPVLEAMRARRPNLEITVASSGTGLEYYRSRSVPCADLGIPDDDDQGREAARSVALFLFKLQEESGRPDLVVADEVFSAPKACKILHLDNLLLTHWFFSEVGNPGDDLVLNDANGIVFLDFAAIHQVPAHIQAPVHFTGPLAKQFSTSRDQARQQLGLAPDRLAVVATFGAFRPDKLPDIQTMLHTVLVAWRANARSTDRLFVLAEPGERLGITEVLPEESVEWVGVTKTPELYYAAADLVLTYATLTTLSELARNGVPTVSITGSINPIDNRHAMDFDSLGLIQTADLDVEPDQLWSLGQVAMRRQAKGRSVEQTTEWADPASVAMLILSHL
jgi:hypothetical protein